MLRLLRECRPERTYTLYGSQLGGDLSLAATLMAWRIEAGPHSHHSRDGTQYNTDQPLTAEQVELLHQAVTREGWTANDVSAVTFDGEHPPVLDIPEWIATRREFDRIVLNEWH